MPKPFTGVRRRRNLPVRHRLLIGAALAAIYAGGCGQPAKTVVENPVVATDTPALLHMGGATIAEEFPGPLPGVTDDDIRHWIKESARAVTNYYGHYPVKKVRIVVSASRRDRVNSGMAFGGELIRIKVGQATKPADLDRDWSLTHEMFHLGFPEVNEDYHYLEEGLSDYLEPLARARVGNLSEAEVWKGFVEGMPLGQPGQNGGGLDGTAEWGRVYWGGAIFWLEADVRIRQQTQNHKSLDNAIRAINQAGGDGTRHWPLQQVIDVGDRATGTTVLRDVHNELGLKPGRVDLGALWQRLGIAERGGVVQFDDAAPLGLIRKSMTARS